MVRRRRIHHRDRVDHESTEDPAPGAASSHLDGRSWILQSDRWRRQGRRVDAHRQPLPVPQHRRRLRRDLLPSVARGDDPGGGRAASSILNRSAPRRRRRGDRCRCRPVVGHPHPPPSGRVGDDRRTDHQPPLLGDVTRTHRHRRFRTRSRRTPLDGQPPARDGLRDGRPRRLDRDPRHRRGDRRERSPLGRAGAPHSRDTRSDATVGGTRRQSPHGPIGTAHPHPKADRRPRSSSAHVPDSAPRVRRPGPVQPHDPARCRLHSPRPSGDGPAGTSRRSERDAGCARGDPAFGR